MDIVLRKSPLKTKKYRVDIDSSRGKARHIDFGAKGYEDYTIHHNEKRKQLYINRHHKRENWNDPYTAGFWSRWLLWNKPSIDDSMYDICKILVPNSVHIVY